MSVIKTSQSVGLDCSHGAMGPVALDALHTRRHASCIFPSHGSGFHEQLAESAYSGSEPDRHKLRLQIGVQTLESQLAAEPRLLHAAERALWRSRNWVVDS